MLLEAFDIAMLFGSLQFLSPFKFCSSLLVLCWFDGRCSFVLTFVFSYCPFIPLVILILLLIFVITVVNSTAAFHLFFFKAR